MNYFANFKVIPLNVRGFSRHKVDFFFDLVRANYDIGFIQESLITEEKVFQSLASQWSGPCFWSPAIGKQGGIMVLISPNFEGKVLSWRRDSSGRILSLLISLKDTNFNLLNIYAPTEISKRTSFFQSLHRYFYPHSVIIIGGDFNCYDNPLDKFGGNLNLFRDFTAFKSSFQFTDAWRQKHPHVRQYTWFNSDYSIGSRLDTFLVSRDLLCKVRAREITPCVMSDHDFVDISLKIDDSPQPGPGIWKMNNSLLEDEDYCIRVQKVIEQHLQIDMFLFLLKNFGKN